MFNCAVLAETFGHVSIERLPRGKQSSAKAMLKIQLLIAMLAIVENAQVSSELSLAAGKSRNLRHSSQLSSSSTVDELGEDMAQRHLTALFQFAS